MSGLKQKKMIRQAIGKEELVQSFYRLGVREGMTLEVHSSLSSLGYVIGGAQAVVDALLDAVGYQGTIVMPLQDSNNTEPTFWQNPPADPALWDRIRDQIPAFDGKTSDVPFMGAVVENFRRRQGVYTSYHPNSAFAAYGKYAKLICSRHRLDYSLSKSSPLGQLMQLNAYVLLIGVDYTNCTGMHLGEYRSGVRPVIIQGGAIETDAGREWVKYLDIDLDSDEFVEPGRQLEDMGLVKQAEIGKASCRLFPLRQAVDITSAYLQKKYAYQETNNTTKKFDENR